MSKLNEMIIFNRFPATKKVFCDFLNMASENDAEIASALFLEPRTYERIYITMTENELKSVAKRRGDTELANCFPKWDAIYSYKGHCIVLHIPAMALKLSRINLRSNDPEGKVLFTIHLFGCFFHELGHACYASRAIVDSIGVMIFGSKPVEFDIEQSEKNANQYEDRLVKRFGEILYKKGLSWGNLADQLLNWEKLRPVLWRPRT